MNTNNKINGFIYLLILCCQVYSTSFSFFSHSKISGCIKDSMGNPISWVEVKGMEDCLHYNIYNKKIIYHSFTDSLGCYSLELIMHDGDHLDKIKSTEQIAMCKKSISELSKLSSINSRAGINENSYKRSVLLSFSRIGFKDTLINIDIDCRMDSVNVPENRLTEVVLEKNENKENFADSTLKNYYQHRIYNVSENEYIIKNEIVKIHSRNATAVLSRNLDSNRENNLLVESFKMRHTMSILSNVTMTTAVLGGITGAIILRHERNVIYPIVTGIAIASVVFVIDIKATRHIKYKINEYNRVLTNSLISH